MYRNFKFLFYIILIILPLLFDCPAPVTNESNDNNDTETDSGFWAGNFATGYYYKTEATKMYKGTKCVIYVEKKSIDTVSVDTINQVGYIFDNTIYSKITGNFGNESDVDGNGKITLFILDIQDSTSNIVGYFDPNNLLDFQCSNEADMIYIDCYLPFSFGAGDLLYETICHEFQHLINYYENVFVEGGNEQDLWINEGLSSAAETLYDGDIITEKVSFFNNNSTVGSGTYFVYEDNWYSNNAYASYSTVYLFFQWLRLQGTYSIFKDIIDSASNDSQAVVNAAVSRIGGFSSNDWTGVFSDWLIANYLCNNTGRYGYLGNPDLVTVPQNYPIGGAVNLFPGGAVYKDISAAFIPSGTQGVNINYIGITAPGAPIVIDRDSIGGYDGEYLITYNSDSNPTNSTQSSAGNLPATSIILSGTKTISSLKSSKGQFSYKEKPFMIDAVIGKKIKFRNPK